MTDESPADLLRAICADLADIKLRLDRIEARQQANLNGKEFPTVITSAIPKLNPKQKEVLVLICKGETNKHIARTLKLPESTVKARVRDVMHKLVVTNRTQIAIVAARMRLV